MVDFSRLALPFLHRLPPEWAHTLVLRSLRSSFFPFPMPQKDDPALAVNLWGREFSNPIGLAAGFDKDAEVPAEMLRFGFGFVECGSVTPRAQIGNPRPRLFRLSAQRALINRLGFNNHGLTVFLENLRAARRQDPAGIIGVNIGKNKDSPDAAADYVTSAASLAPYADYLVVNVSSPNTPGLRGLQNRGELSALLAAVRQTLDGLPVAPPLLVKVAPDLEESALADIAAVALEQKISGLIVSNTTIARPEGLPPEMAREAGGLSGAPLYAPATEVLRALYRLTGGQLPLIGVGGVSSGADAYGKIRAGASLVQLYTALIYEGMEVVLRIKRELADLLARDGFARLADAVGADHR